MDTFDIKDAVVISSDVLPRKVVIADPDFKKINGNIFIRLSTQLTYCESLFTLRDKEHRQERRCLSRSNIFDIVRKERDRATAETIKRIKDEHGLKHKSETTKPRDQANEKRNVPLAVRAVLPKVVSITIPSFDDLEIPAFGMNVELSIHRNSPLFVQLTSANLHYIRSVAAAQIEGGSYKRTKPKASPRKDDVDDEMPSVNIDVAQHASGLGQNSDTDDDDDEFFMGDNSLRAPSEDGSMSLDNMSDNADTGIDELRADPVDIGVHIDPVDRRKHTHPVGIEMHMSPAANAPSSSSSPSPKTPVQYSIKSFFQKN